MKYYTYRISNIHKNKHYYGYRSTSCAPDLDLGIKYFSSSTDKDFIKDQKENPQNYKYKIIRVYDNKYDALNLEIKLHKKFMVDLNESFYNIARQKSNRVSVQTKESIEKMVKTRTENGSFKETGRKNSRRMKGKALYYNENNIPEFIIVEEAKRRNLTALSKGRSHSEETKLLYSEQRKGNQFKTGIKESPETCLKKSKNAKENNSQAKYFTILNHKDEIMFECYSNFKQICIENDLPYHSLRRTKENNSRIKYNSKVKNIENFIGWRVIENEKS